MPMPADRFLAATHSVENQPRPLQDYNAYHCDPALQDWVARYDGAGAERELAQLGDWVGSAEAIALGVDANANPPELVTHDRYGRRLDEVRFHPAYHRLMSSAIERRLHASPWQAPGAGAQVIRAAKVYLQSQVEAAHQCPITMTFASLPVIRREPRLAAVWEPLITAAAYDGANHPYGEKPGVTIGMAMTEKQGGSDVRSNTTEAHLLEQDSGLYELVGHKYFVSAPMCDAFLIMAQTAAGPSCFLMPRWRPDGQRNAVQIQRLKQKMGNVANATAEVELRGAHAWLVGEPGRGIATILEMVALTRFDCMIGSSAGMRQAVAQANHHCRHRRAFGARLVDQPLMRNVLADLNLEWEAALALTLRTARALDRRAEDSGENLLLRILTPIGKYWICKRTPAHAGEAMECIGGSGVMEDSIMPRLFRESPVNATWEGSGNVQCLDVLRVIQRHPEALEALLAEIGLARGADQRLDRFVAALEKQLASAQSLPYRARDLVERMALALQGALLVGSGNSALADAFCAARLDSRRGCYLYGGLPAGVDVAALLARAGV